MDDFLLQMIQKYLKPVLDHEPAIAITVFGIVVEILNKLRQSGKVPATASPAFSLLIRVLTLFAVRKLVKPTGLRLPAAWVDSTAAHAAR